jgi:hypothetical protein
VLSSLVNNTSAPTGVLWDGYVTRTMAVRSFSHLTCACNLFLLIQNVRCGPHVALTSV